MANLHQLCIDGDCSEVQEYTAGENITISDGVISAVDTTYTAGTGIDITNNVISTTIDEDLYIVVQTLPQTGEYNKIYLTPKEGGGFTEWAYINDAWEEIGDTEIDLSDYYTKDEADALLDAKQNKLTAGANVQINGNTISATDTKYTAGTNITISGTTISAPNVYTKTETDELLDDKADVTSVYTKTEVNDLIDDFITCTTLADCPAFTDLSDEVDGKQDALTAGDNIQISGNTISATDTKYTAGTNITINGTTISAPNVYTKTETDALLDDKLECADLDTCPTIVDMGNAIDDKQDKLTAGSNIQISGNTISATDTKYTAGNNVQISSGNVISATDTKYTAGTNISISSGNVISAPNVYTKTETDGLLDDKQDKLTAGNNITITGNTISATDTKYTAGANVQINGTTISATDTKYTAGTNISISGTTISSPNVYTKTQTDDLLDTKQDTLTAGDNITISGNTISATDTTYTAGAGIDITNKVVKSTVPRGTLDNNTDVNNVKGNSVYGLAGSRTYTNLPSGITFGLLVTEAHTDGTTTFSTQRVFDGVKCYERFHNGSSWQGWRELTNTGLPAWNETESASFTSKGLTFTFTRRGKGVQVHIMGVTNAAINSQGTYVNMGTISSATMRPLNSYWANVFFGSTNDGITYFGQINITNTGAVRFGYSVNTSGASSNMPSGFAIIHAGFYWAS